MRHKAIIVLVSADAEWSVVQRYFSKINKRTSPFGEWFVHKYQVNYEKEKTVVFMHGGWGKVAAAASTQYAIESWRPFLVINLGTCGGFKGDIARGEIILAEKTIIYDIYELMGDSAEHIRHYATEIDNSWISKPYPIPVKPSLIVSGDRDLFTNDIAYLREKYHAIVGDWESGAIAWVSKMNHTRSLILRGVTDIVGEEGGEAYGNLRLFTENTEVIMKNLLDSLPQWIIKFYEKME